MANQYPNRAQANFWSFNRIVENPNILYHILTSTPSYRHPCPYLTSVLTPYIYLAPPRNFHKLLRLWGPCLFYIIYGVHRNSFLNLVADPSVCMRTDLILCLNVGPFVEFWWNRLATKATCQPTTDNWTGELKRSL